MPILSHFPRIPNTQQLHIIKDRPTQRRKIVTPRGVKRAEEHDPGPGRARHEPKNSPLEPAFPLGLVRDLKGSSTRERLNDHGPLARVASVPHGEEELVGFTGYGAYHLGYRALFPGH